VSSVSILLEEKVSFLGSPNFIFIALAFRKTIVFVIGARGGVVVKALRYKGRGIDSRWCHWNFSET